MDALLWDKHEGDGRILTPLQSMASGFLAACLGPVATGPFDVAKTRLMAQSKSGGPPKYSVSRPSGSLAATMRQLHRQRHLQLCFFSLKTHFSLLTRSRLLSLNLYLFGSLLRHLQ
jgi:hypothetical protein